MAKPGIRGALDRCDRRTIEGWAFDATDPAAPVEVEILGDGQVLARILADQFRADLAGMEGTRGFCAFAHPWRGQPPRGGTVMTLRARGRRAAFTRPATMPEAENGTSELQGAVDILDRQQIAGWLRAPSDDRPVTFDLVHNGTAIGAIVANAFRPDLRDAGIGNGHAGFAHVFQPPLNPTVEHRLDIRPHGDDRQILPWTPLRLPSSRTLDDALKAHLARTLSGIADDDAREAAIAFLLAQVENLRGQHGLSLARGAQRSLQRRALRRHEDAMPEAARALVLVIDERAPDPGRDAGSVALLSHMAAIRDCGFDVAFAASRVPVGKDAAAFLHARDITVLGAPAFTAIEDILARFGAGLAAIYLHRLGNAGSYLELCRVHAPTATVLWSVADLASVRLRRQATIEQRPELTRTAGRIETRECMAAWAADTVITHAEWETERLRHLVPTAQVATIGWSVDRAGPRRTPRRPTRRRTGPPRIAFVGHFGHAPNLDAAKFLATEILPRLRARRPDIACHLIGSAMNEAVIHLGRDGLVLDGFVPDLRAHLATFDVCIAPLRFGAGIKGKILEAWAAELPVMMTPIAAEGLFAPDHPVLARDIADDPDALAAGVLRLLASDAARAHLDAAHTILEARFSASAIREAFARYLPDPDPFGLLGETMVLQAADP